MHQRSEPRSEVSGAPSQTGSRFFLGYLVLTAVVCGALVMVIEVLGSRVIGPFFGVSLFVWTSLITVTLISLSAGYAVGGVVSDRRGSPSVLYGAILGAGVLSLLIPVLREPVLKATLSWGLRAGAFASSLALFGPALFLLGCVSPFIVRIAAREMRNIGRTVGLFAALSTFGSFLGTVLTGFVLIAFFSVSTIFLVTGTLLIAISACYFLFFRRSGYTLMTLVLPVLLSTPQAPISKVMANGTRVERVYATDTFYGNLKVVDYSYGPRRQRELMIDGLIQGGMDMQSGLPTYEYAYFLQFLPYAANSAGKTCLVLGLGAGLVPRWFEERGVRTDVVEIDPEVVAVARDYFGFSVSGDVIVSDARWYLNSTGKRYDYVILDVFNGDTTPGHLLSREALELVRSRMADRGVLAVNLIGSMGSDRFMTDSIIRTLESVFRTVNVYPLFDPAGSERRGNIAVLASPSLLPPLDRRAVAPFPVHAAVAGRVEQHLRLPYAMPRGPESMLLTDDHNPVDFHDVELKEWVRGTILKHLDTDIVL